MSVYLSLVILDHGRRAVLQEVLGALFPAARRRKVQRSGAARSTEIDVGHGVGPACEQPGEFVSPAETTNRNVLEKS